ncbi:D-beta-hydroxybutyrate dehydrogenase, mitochondrial-like [Mytilus californianus]|uniref:D-beta-hydroxybutyrate dehydrogenase, mitochondrial-like n=1 Tax=Mytilus californianus TaxID=6549 RepID=UPI0022471135|nr:D-beta-hydroxybutyrate dehydrogenase, mitochondrial-like [Mytilus californianus]
MNTTLVYRMLMFIFLSFFTINICIDYYVYIISLLVLKITYSYVEPKFKELLPVDKKAVLITGCDTGFGHFIAIRLAKDGFVVFAGVLDINGKGANTLKDRKLQNLHLIQLNVTKSVQIQEAVNHVQKTSGGLWGIINNAGFGIPGDIEFVLLDHYRKCQEVNLNGQIAIVKAFLPMIRKSKGRIVNVSSVIGRFSWPGFSNYVITKHGVETLTDSLRLEMAKFGVGVSMIEPGSYSHATGFTSDEVCERLKKYVDEMWHASTPEMNETYGEKYPYLAYKMFLGFNSDYNDTNAEKVVVPVMDAMVDALVNIRPKPRYLVAGGTGLCDINALYALFYQYMPEFISDYIISRHTGCFNPIAEQTS